MDLNPLKEIDRTLSRTQYIGLVKIKRLFKFKYPKLLFLLILTIIAYNVFSNPLIQTKINQISTPGYLELFAAGMLFSFGFTTPFAIGFFLTINPENMIIASLIAGLGALTSDIIIFKTIRFSLINEFRRLEKIKSMQKFERAMSAHISFKIKNYLLYIFAGIIIASPLPDEIGVSMLAGLTQINPKIFAFLSFLFNTLGILLILFLSTLA